MLKNLILFLTILPAYVFAQNTISGTVVSMVNNKAVPTASVFLSNTGVGATTQPDGSFILNNVKSGQYDLVVTCLGYEPAHLTVMMNYADKKLDTIQLMPKVTALKEITVRVKDDKEREALIRKFTFEFFGHGPNAGDCKLLNPELLDIEKDKVSGVITASSSDFLIIENSGLGYRVKYLLSDFALDPKTSTVSYAGSYMFEPMTGDVGQQKKWQKKRINAYLGSDMHFLRACIANDIFAEGFVVCLYGDREAIPMQSDQFIRLTQVKGIYAFGFPEKLMIRYKNNMASSTVVSFNKPFSYFDSNGVIFNPKSNSMKGKWATNRVAELLPVDYELPATF